MLVSEIVGASRLAARPQKKSRLPVPRAPAPKKPATEHPDSKRRSKRPKPFNEPKTDNLS